MALLLLSIALFFSCFTLCYLMPATRQTPIYATKVALSLFD